MVWEGEGCERAGTVDNITLGTFPCHTRPARWVILCNIAYFLWFIHC